MFNWSNQVMLLTGGTGSFGQAFTQYILKKHPPRILRIYSRDEFKQFQMQQKFRHRSLRYFIGDVRDKERLKRAMVDVTLVVHAAAMKQILACEYNPSEAIYTNIIGAMNVMNVAIDAGVKKIMALVTDKAVSPINLYGATKLCMEKLLIQGNTYRGKKKILISCVRYGNVAVSRGSVIPLFWEQKKKTQLTVTDKQATRFWITLEQGVKFVTMCIEKMIGGEIFIPKMPSFKVYDLAKVIAPRAKIKIIGLRKGEKLHEDLITVHEAANVLEFRRHYIIKPTYEFWTEADKISKLGGKKASRNFNYNSRTNSQFLTMSKLKKELQRIDPIQFQ